VPRRRGSFFLSSSSVPPHTPPFCEEKSSFPHFFSYLKALPFPELSPKVRSTAFFSCFPLVTHLLSPLVSEVIPQMFSCTLDFPFPVFVPTAGQQAYTFFCFPCPSFSVCFLIPACCVQRPPAFPFELETPPPSSDRRPRLFFHFLAEVGQFRERSATQDNLPPSTTPFFLSGGTRLCDEV